MPATSWIAENDSQGYIFRGNNELAVRIDFHLKCGSIYDPNPALAAAVNSLFSESTLNKNSDILAKMLDQKGVFLDRECGRDFSRFTVFCLKHNLNEVIDLVKEIFQQPGFEQNDLDIYTNQKIQKHKMNQERNSWVASKAFLEKLFPSGHRYGTISDTSDYAALERSKLESFFNSNYTSSNAFWIASGAVSEDIGQQLKDLLPKEHESSTIVTKNSMGVSKVTDGVFYVDGPNKKQTAMKMGGLSLPRNHPDFAGLSVVYTILGGYFGSRLMKNIREEKGLTYGISAGIAHCKHASYWTIQSEIKSGSETLVLEEIWKEMQSLKENLVEENELTVVKNYLLGVYSRLFDGVFSKPERLVTLLQYDLPVSYYTDHIQKIKEISAKDIQLLANTYLNQHETTTVLVG